MRRATGAAGVFVCVAAVGCQGQEAPQESDPAVASVRAWDTGLRFVADAVQLSTGEVAAVGVDADGRGAVHIVRDDQVRVLFAGAPLGFPTGVDVDSAGTLAVTDLGGADEHGAPGPVDATDDGPTGGLFRLTTGGGAPSLVTGAIAAPQGVAAASDGLLYVTGFTSDGQPAVFSVVGATVDVVVQGDPMVMPGDLTATGEADAVRLWVVDSSGGRDAVVDGGASLLIVDPDASSVVTGRIGGIPATGVTRAGAAVVVAAHDPLGAAQALLVDAVHGTQRDIALGGDPVRGEVTGAGAGADPTRPVFAGGASGEVLVSF